MPNYGVQLAVMSGLNGIPSVALIFALLNSSTGSSGPLHLALAVLVGLAFIGQLVLQQIQYNAWKLAIKQTFGDLHDEFPSECHEGCSCDCSNCPTDKTQLQ